MRHRVCYHTLNSPGVALFGAVVSVRTKNVIFAVLFSLSMLMLPYSAMAENDSEEPTYRVYGSLFNDLGDEAGNTSIKLDSLESVWSENDAQYEITGVTHGEHTIRAYFMNDGHTVVYRTIYITGDTELDFRQGSNWVTGTLHHLQSDIVSVDLIEQSEQASLTESRFEFGPHPVGEYCTLVAEWERDSVMTSQYLRMRIEEGSSATPDINHVEFHYGMNNIYGLITDADGTPVSGALVSNGIVSAVSNNDGFYLMKNLSIDSEQTITIQQEGNELLPPVQYLVTSGENWLNLTTVTDVEFPGNVTFTTQTQTVLMSPFYLEWDGGDYTDYYSVYHGEISDGNQIYRGSSERFEYTPSQAGTHEFNIVAHNINGSNENSPSLVIIVLPNPSSDLVWQAGMSWDYFISHTPEYFHNRTYTMIGTETIEDAFGREQETFLVRISDDTYLAEEKAFRWFDVSNLLTVKSYWVDDPSSSSYFQEGTMGWQFTTQGEDAELFSGDAPDSLHFNRTNIIGVPGHPNGYDDTENTVFIEENVEVTVFGQSYLTTYIAISDDEDGVLSWELWYNSSVRNYVKIVDRLPGSHSDTVVYELTGYEIPTKPKFITESSTTKEMDYPIEWAEFPSATLYQVLENDQIIYEGNNLHFNITNAADGSHIYSINAFTDIGYLIEGDEIEVIVDFIPESPVINPIGERVFSSAESINVSWSSTPDAVWYSLMVQDLDGNVAEMYNGTDTFIILSDLSSGQNRMRVNVMVNDKVSDYSPSEFVTIEDQKDAEEQSLTSISFAVTSISLLVVSVLVPFWRDDDV